jgi:hypothetical protein
MHNARYIRRLAYKSILRSEDIFSVRDNTGQLDYREMGAQRWAIVTVSPSQGGMRPANDAASIEESHSPRRKVTNPEHT